MAYADLLKDPRWQKKRLQILERDQWICLNCLDSESTLHVHHQRYYGKPWECPDEFLITLCESCHKNESGPKEDLFKYVEGTGITRDNLINLLKRVKYRMEEERGVQHPIHALSDIMDEIFPNEKLWLVDPELKKIREKIYG